MRTACFAMMMGTATLVGCRAPDQVGPTAGPALDAQHVEAARLLRSPVAPRRPTPVFIDGQRFVRRDGGEGEFNLIDPDRIASIRLLTGTEAEARAGAEGRGGVIWITTKEAAR